MAVCLIHMIFGSRLCSHTSGGVLGKIILKVAALCNKTKPGKLTDNLNTIIYEFLLNDWRYSCSDEENNIAGS